MVNKRIILLVSFVWFVSIMAFLIYAAGQKLVAFDHAGKLWQLSQNQQFDQAFSDEIAMTLGDLSNRVVHFSQAQCECNSVAQEHIQSVRKLAQQQGYSNTSVDVDKQLAVLNYLPATPAVAVFDETGGLIYLGPYSAGYSCSAGNGIVESFIARTVTAPGASIITDTEGCYCSI